MASAPRSMNSFASRPRHTAEIAQFAGVDKSYGRTRALVDFTFEVRAGELVTLLGPNGAGKTTAIKLLLGLVRPTSGKLSVFGGDPASTQTHTRIGAMLQVGRVPETLRVREHIDGLAASTSVVLSATTRSSPRSGDVGEVRIFRASSACGIVVNGANCRSSSKESQAWM